MDLVAGKVRPHPVMELIGVRNNQYSGAPTLAQACARRPAASAGFYSDA